MAKVTLKGLSHSYLKTQSSDADWAIRGVDIDWNDGGAYALLGPSGCGKTTLLNIKDGEYKVGIRPHNITTYKEGNNTLEIKGKVLISEISGSESLIHFTNGNLSWVSLSNGVFQKNVGDEMNLYMNTDEFVYFDQNERLVSNG